MGPSLSAAEARRIFLNAQGLARRRPTRRVGERQFREYLARQGVLQLDTVNVFARAHYMPVFSRYGAYATSDLDAYLWGDPDGHSAHCFEHWGHEASVMPLDLLPAMHDRMVGPTPQRIRFREHIENEAPGVIEAVLGAVRDAPGPVPASSLDHLAPSGRGRAGWWDHGAVKWALEYLFFTGRVAATRGKHFTRLYDAPERAWAVPGAGSGAWGLAADDAHQALFDRALAACGIGTPADLADHFRLHLAPRPEEHMRGASVGAAGWADSAVERGLAAWVEVEGWGERALLAADATDPGRATGAALLSPFDPVCWYRERLLRMFGMHYRIEIYTPEPKREFGYYTLPFLLGDQIVGRFDLKADRKAGRLLVRASWREDRAVAGARRRSDAEIASALATELRLAASWLGLDDVVVEPRGNLADAVAESVGT